jgi:hypothetical protein
MELVNVVCVYWGNKYSPDYVSKLYNMVKRNLSIPFRFIVYTDHPSQTLAHEKNDFRNNQIPDYQTRKLPFTNYDGWWNKLTLFSPEADLKGTCLYFDLDVVILDNIDDMALFGKEDTFGVINDFNPASSVYNSSIMKFNNITAEHIWTSFKKDETNMMRHHGDQQVMSHFIKSTPHCKVMPDEWTFSYKWFSREAPRIDKSQWTFDQKPNAKVCVFHGLPNPHESTKKWVQDNWK